MKSIIPMSVRICLLILCLWLTIPFLLHAQHEEAQGDVKNYKENNVFYEGNEITIAATLIFPEGEGPFPGIVIAHGSERAPRTSPHYRNTAIEFVKRGIAVLIPDKRGVGESTGTYSETGYMRDKAKDVVVSVEYLAQRREIISDKVGIIGFSQGGWTAPIASVISDKVAFVITASGPGVSPREQIIYQGEQELLDKGYSVQAVAEISGYRSKLYKYYATGSQADRSVVEKLHQKVKNKKWFKDIGFTDTIRKPEELQSKNFDFYRQADYEPAQTLKSVPVHMLALFGSKDRHIPVEASIEAMKKAFEKNHKGTLTIEVFEGAGHPLRIVKAQKEPIQGHNPNAYGERPDSYWETIFDWLEGIDIIKS